MKRAALSLFAAFLLIWAIGCSDNPTNTEGSLADAFGGYTTDTEDPGFGDTELVAAADEVEVDDPILATAEMTELTSDIDAGMFHFRAVWGQIPGDPTVLDLTDWTGSLTINRGGIVVRRLIRFELNQDFYLPRTDRKLVEWISFTNVHNDGMAFDIYVPSIRPEIDTSYVVDTNGDTTWTYTELPVDPVTVTLETGPYTRTFTLDELAALDELVELDDGNSVALHGVQFFRQICPRGILAGEWGSDNAGNGVFKGRWFSPFGRVIGYLHGEYGQDENGHNMFYGKWIDESGAFEGLLRGRYGVRFCANTDTQGHCRNFGWFAGLIFDANSQAIGALGGLFANTDDVPGGWFGGRWKLFCGRGPGWTTADDRPANGYGYGVMHDGINQTMMD